jgi:hypothetical protein
MNDERAQIGLAPIELAYAKEVIHSKPADDLHRIVRTSYRRKIRHLYYMKMNNLLIGDLKKLLQFGRASEEKRKPMKNTEVKEKGNLEKRNPFDVYWTRAADSQFILVVALLSLFYYSISNPFYAKYRWFQKRR